MLFNRHSLSRQFTVHRSGFLVLTRLSKGTNQVDTQSERYSLQRGNRALKMDGGSSRMALDQESSQQTMRLAILGR